MNRREFLATLFGTAAGAAVQPVVDQRTLLSAVAGRLASAPRGVFAAQGADQRDPAMHVINRLTYGVSPSLYEHIRAVGVDAYIEAQLNPETVADDGMDAHLAPYQDVLSQNAAVLTMEYRLNQRRVVEALVGGLTLRALYSERQLYERMVAFFSDHFSIFIRKGRALFLKVDDDRDVIRPHAMGNFRELLGASAHSPAMLFYLDNVNSNQRAPNENYARELMELHTLGVGGGYTEDDVKEVARVFTGWSINNAVRTGESGFHFRPAFHDPNPKRVLGVDIPPGGEDEGEAVLDLLASNRSTAKYVSFKLARRFVSDLPPDDLVETMADTFMSSNGDIRQVLRVLFASSAFWNAPPKFKQPYEYVISIMRALVYTISDGDPFWRRMTTHLQALGHLPFTWTTPDGFPDVQSAWIGGIMPRWNVTHDLVTASIRGSSPDRIALADLMDRSGVEPELDGVVDFLGQYLFGRALTTTERALTLDLALDVSSDDIYIQTVAALSLLFASPAFQYR